VLKSYLGPNVVTGHASVIFSQEAQVRAGIIAVLSDRIDAQMSLNIDWTSSAAHKACA